MIRIYSLSIQAFLHFTELKCFDIGFFRTRDEAQVVAHRYLSEVRGFRDFYCEASISEKTLDADTEPEFVYTFFGTDEDDFGNAIGIAGPHCYADRERAEAALTDAMSMSPEKIWAIRPWQIGKCEWSNGFTPRMAGYSSGTTMAQHRHKLRRNMEQRSRSTLVFAYDCGTDISGFPAKAGDLLFLLALEDRFQLDGFFIGQFRHIETIIGQNELYQKICRSEGLTEFEIPPVDLTGWESIFSSLQKLGVLIQIQRIDFPFEPFIGRIESCDDESFEIRCVDEDGIWDEAPATMYYGSLLSLRFGTRYLKTLSKYV